MKIRSPNNADTSAAGDAMRAALDRQLRDAGAGKTGRTPPPIPDHGLLHRIGRGAYGEVWLARSTLGTLRAVKIVYRAGFEDDHPYEREFKGIVNYEPVSRSHEGLVQVLHVGRNDEAECFYYVMELADAQAVNEPTDAGESEKSAAAPPAHPPVPPPTELSNYKPRTLRSELARRQRVPPADAARFALRLANALGYLHSHGLVHRDIKPSNVIFVGGQPKLADIGLVTGAGSSRTFVGTEGFIPPEGPGTPHADLYGLGKLLYEIATGRDRMEFPQLPPLSSSAEASESDTEALLELNEVMTRACAPRRSERYASAAEMQADLNLFLAGRSLQRARSIERHLTRLKRFAAVACVFLVVAVAAIWFLKREAQQANERAVTESTLRQRAEAAERETQQRLYTALLEQARATVRSGELGQRVNALDAVRQASAISNSAALRGVALAAYALPDLRLERELPYGAEFTLRLVDPSFERIALCRGSGPVEIRSLIDRQSLATLPASTNLPAHYAEWSADGGFLAIKRDRDANGTRSDKEVWDVYSGRRLLLLSDIPYTAMSFDPLSPQLLVGRDSGVSLWDLGQGIELRHLQLNGTPRWLRISPDGKRFAVNYPAGRDWIVSIHQIDDGELLASNIFDRVVASFNWHPSGRWISVADYGGGIYWMEARTGKRKLLGQHKAEATRVEFTPDGDYFMSGGWDRELICWDARSLKRAFGVWLDGYVGHFRSDGQAYMLETETGMQLHSFERVSGPREFPENLGSLVRYAAFSPDGRWLAASGTAGVEVWDMENGGPGALAPEAWATRACFAANGELFASRPGGCFRWRVSPGVGEGLPPKLERLGLSLPERFASLCTFSNSVLITTARGTTSVEPNSLAESPQNWKGTATGWNGASPDGKWFGVFPRNTPYLFVHRLPDLKRVAILTNASNVSSFQFSPAHDELAVSCRLGVEFWSTATWMRTRAVTNLNNQLYSADGRTMWLTQQYHAGGLHDAHTLKLLFPLPIGTYPLAVSPDGRWLAASINLRRLQVLDLEKVRKQLAELGLDWPQR